MAVVQVPHATYQEFRDAVNGRGFDCDGLYGYQCYDGVDLLYEQSDVGQYLSTANTGLVKNCWLNSSARARNGSGHFEQITSVSSIKRGDIIVFNTYSGWYGLTGHIGFADEDYNGTQYIKILSQNFGTGANPTTGKPFNIANAYLGSAFLGVFRYKKWNKSPEPPTPTKTKKRHFPFPVAWRYWWGMS